VRPDAVSVFDVTAFAVAGAIVDAIGRTCAEGASTDVCEDMAAVTAGDTNAAEATGCLMLPGAATGTLSSLGLTTAAFLLLDDVTLSRRSTDTDAACLTPE
jgi:hypothetical protein